MEPEAVTPKVPRKRSLKFYEDFAHRSVASALLIDKDLA